MKSYFPTQTTILAILFAHTVSCEHTAPEVEGNIESIESAIMENANRLVAVIHPTQGNQCHGLVMFNPTNNGVHVTAEIGGLQPNQKHGIHIHEWGDCSKPDGTSAGGHYNPQGHQHGLPNQDKRHAGDLGNLQADSNGPAHYELTVTNISLDGARNPILGRAVIVHEERDDGGQPSGNAGARIACGVIAIANPNPK